MDMKHIKKFNEKKREKKSSKEEEFGFSAKSLEKDKEDKEKEDKASEFSGEIGFKAPRSRNYDSGDRTPRMSDDYAKGGMTASSRADGCATKGKTKGRFV